MLLDWKRHTRKAPNHSSRHSGAPISILKPVKGWDDGLRENLESFFLLEYPHFEILFCVEDEDDLCLDTIRSLLQEYGHVPARLLLGKGPAIENPKVRNLMKGYTQAYYDWVLISDSNIRVKPDYLSRLSRYQNADLGVLTSIVAGTYPKTFSAHLEAIILNTFYARWMKVTAYFGKPCVIGKSMMFHKKVAERFGGIQALGRYLAEDFMMGEAMRYLGYRVVIAQEPIRQYIGSYSFMEFWRRHIRWGRLRKAHAPLAFLIEPLFGAIGSGLLGAFSFSYFWNIPPVIFFAYHFALWSLCDAIYLLHYSRPGLSLITPFVWILREMLAFPLWIGIAIGNTVHWRGKKLKLGLGGVIHEEAKRSSFPLGRRHKRASSRGR